MLKNKNINKAANKQYLKAYSLTEILIVLAIIGILLMMVLPNQTSVVAQAKSIEAQKMLNHLYGLQKSYNYRFSKYSSSFEELGFEVEATIDEGGQAVYKIEIIDASVNTFKARAVSVKDFDDDGNFNTWEIDHRKFLTEPVKD
ncbi:MAG: type II secretion system protein [Flavobacteriaceae bacterium]|nr:type II secretion system protein [Flavobacteriaceae bacterium]